MPHEIILSGGPGNGHEISVPDDAQRFIWFQPHGSLEYKPLVQDGILLPVWIPDAFIPNPYYDPNEPF